MRSHPEQGRSTRRLERGCHSFTLRSSCVPVSRARLALHKSEDRALMLTARQRGYDCLDGHTSPGERQYTRGVRATDTAEVELGGPEQRLGRRVGRGVMHVVHAKREGACNESRYTRSLWSGSSLMNLYDALQSPLRVRPNFCPKYSGQNCPRTPRSWLCYMHPVLQTFQCRPGDPTLSDRPKTTCQTCATYRSRLTSQVSRWPSRDHAVSLTCTSPPVNETIEVCPLHDPTILVRLVLCWIIGSEDARQTPSCMARTAGIGKWHMPYVWL